MTDYTLISDLHADFHGGFAAPLKELVIVAGDTANSVGAASKLLESMREKGHKVFAVPGNHEQYGNIAMQYSLAECERAFRNAGSGNPSLFFGEGFNIIGACGWYLIEDERHWQGYLSDARFVSARDVNTAARVSADFLDHHLEHSTVPCVVVTHTAPCEESLDPKFAGSDGNCYFWNPLLKPLLAKHKDKIIRWHHGHTHAAMDVVVDGVNIITNPRGYPGENEEWAAQHFSVPVA